ncbi:MAG: tRNA (adenosine(37)-N6)-threonylcarbamoyltransferase complex ATPase subunit type 1 TsaE [Planctomycetota bacterium]
MRSPEVLARFTSRSPAATRALGAALGARLGPSQGLALSGELGAGKTVLVRGLAEGLGVDEPGEVRSPTWLLMVEHPGPIPLLHLDAYFADRGRDFLADGGQAYLQEGGVLAVEWADRLELPLPEDFLEVELAHLDEEERQVVVRGRPDPWAARLAGLGQGIPDLEVMPLSDR